MVNVVLLLLLAPCMLSSDFNQEEYELTNEITPDEIHNYEKFVVTGSEITYDEKTFLIDGEITYGKELNWNKAAGRWEIIRNEGRYTYGRDGTGWKLGWYWTKTYETTDKLYRTTIYVDNMKVMVIMQLDYKKMIAAKNSEIEAKDAEIKEKDAKIKEKDAEIKAKDVVIEKTTQDYKKIINQKDSEIEGKKDKIIDLEYLIEGMKNALQKNDLVSDKILDSNEYTNAAESNRPEGYSTSYFNNSNAKNPKINRLMVKEIKPEENDDTSKLEVMENMIGTINEGVNDINTKYQEMEKDAKRLKEDLNELEKNVDVDVERVMQIGDEINKECKFCTIL